MDPEGMHQHHDDDGGDDDDDDDDAVPANPEDHTVPCRVAAHAGTPLHSAAKPWQGIFEPDGSQKPAPAGLLQWRATRARVTATPSPQQLLTLVQPPRLPPKPPLSPRSAARMPMCAFHLLSSRFLTVVCMRRRRKTCWRQRSARCVLPMMRPPGPTTVSWLVGCCWLLFAWTEHRVVQ